MTPLCFGDLRRFCDRTNRVSICMKETLQYENYECIDQAPAEYDDLYVYGLGVIKSEFPDEDGGGLMYRHCMEIMLSKEPRTDL